MLKIRNNLLLEAQRLELQTVSELAYYINLSKAIKENGCEVDKYINFMQKKYNIPNRVLQKLQSLKNKINYSHN